MKIVFLDIDGVLNGYNWRNRLVGAICIKVKPLRMLYHKWDLFGVRTLKVLKLKYLLWKTGAEVVLSSSWRFAWNMRDNDNPRIVSLKRKFKWFGIEVIGTTPRSATGMRGDEIQEWLDNTDYQVDNFVILDDETFDLSGFEEHIVKTSSDKMIEKYVPKTMGLKRKHIRVAIRILNECRKENSEFEPFLNGLGV